MLCLISGGGSSLLSLPADGLTLADKQAVNRALLRSGASIDEMNCVRKHLSAIKGGRLAAAALPARVVTLLISDVPGDDPAVIASGPTVPDPTTLRRCAGASSPATASSCRRRCATSCWMRRGRDAQARRSAPRPQRGPADRRAAAQPGGGGRASRASAGRHAGDAGRRARGRGARGGQGAWPASPARCARHGQPVAAPCVLLSGGETTVTVRGEGRGGRNVEFLLGLAVALRRRARHLGDRRRHRRHRRRGGEGRRDRHARHAGPRARRRPRPARGAGRQRRPPLLRGAGRPGRHRPDPDQRQRFPRRARPAGNGCRVKQPANITGSVRPAPRA